MSTSGTTFNWKGLLWTFLVLVAATPWVSAPMALLVGAAFGIILGNPHPELSRKLTHSLLQFSVVGLGAGMDLQVVGRVGAHGVFYTATGIVLTLLFGTMLGQVLGSSGTVSLLVSVGTAICGGSAIAAVAPIIRAKHHDISIALAIVFLLNAAALIVFPWVGHELHLSQQAFGLWSALAVHDTSSVVGTTMSYGHEALAVGTTVKLARALWIVPLALAFAWTHKNKSDVDAGAKIKVPWFILGFLAVAGIATYVPAVAPVAKIVEAIARRGLVVTLFLIGSNLSRQSLKSVGPIPLVHGLVLWGLVATGSLVSIWLGWVNV